MNPERINTPFIIQPSDKGERALDIYSRLLAERIIFLKTEITEERANLIVAQMLVLDAQEPEKEIALYINCYRGSITAAMTVYDAMTQLHSDVVTVCLGTAAGLGAFLLSSGTKGKRYALPNARITIRQPSGETQGKATDIEVAAKEILYLKESINQIFAANTGKSKEQIAFDSERDFSMNAQEAKNYGLIDNIIAKKTYVKQKDYSE